MDVLGVVGALPLTFVAGGVVFVAGVKLEAGVLVLVFCFPDPVCCFFFLVVSVLGF